MSSIGNRFKYLRKHLKMTQKEFSSAVGISQGTLSDIEKDKCYPATETFLSVFRYIDISADWLLKGAGLGPTTSDDKLIEDLLELEENSNKPDKGYTGYLLKIALEKYLLLNTNPHIKEWIELFEAAPGEARPVLLNAARAIAQSYPNRNPNKALSTSPNTAEDEQAAARSDIA